MDRAESSASLPDCLLGRTLNCIRSLAWRSRWAITSDLVHDLEQEARLTLWRALPRLVRLPSPEQEAYAARTVRRAVIRALRRELRQRRGSVSIEDPGVPDLLSEQRSCEALSGIDPHELTPHDLAARFEDPRLTDAFLSLGHEDQTVLALKIVHQYEDSEIASILKITLAAATKRRQRALERLRNWLQVPCPDRLADLPA